MTIQQQLEQDIKTALLAGDKSKTMVLRGLKSALLYAAVELKKRDEGLSEADAIAVLQREAKKRVDSAELYKKAGEQQRLDAELNEKAIIDAYLPAQLGDEQLDELIAQAVKDLGDDSASAMGKTIGAVKQAAAGQADGARIAARVNIYFKDKR